MKTRRNEAAWLTISILPLIAGCAIGPTLYQPLGMGGGYSDIITGPNTAQIQFAGNRYTHSLAVKEYALIRAAELTLAAGFDYFLVENESDYADHYRTPSSVQCNPYSYPSTYCYEIGGDVYTEPRTELSIRMFVGEPPRSHRLLRCLLSIIVLRGVSPDKARPRHLSSKDPRCEVAPTGCRW